MEETDLKVGTFVFTTRPNIIIGRDDSDGMYAAVNLGGANDADRYKSHSKDSTPVVVPGYDVDISKGNGSWVQAVSCRPLTQSEKDAFIQGLIERGVLVPTSVTASPPTPSPSQPSITYRFKVGDKVKRDPKNWKWGDQDGGEGNEGIVKGTNGPPDSGSGALIYRVYWTKNSHANSYRDLDLQPYSSDAVNHVDDGDHVGKFHFHDGKAHLVIWYDSDDRTMGCVKGTGRPLTEFHAPSPSRRPVITDSYIESILRDCHHPKKRALKLDKYGWAWFGKSEFTPAPDDAIGRFFDEYGVDVESPVSETPVPTDPPKLLITDIKVGDFLKRAEDGARLITGIDVVANRVSYVINEHGNDAFRWKIGSESVPISGYHSLDLGKLNGMRDHIGNFVRRATPQEAQELIDKMVTKGALIPDQVPDEDLLEPVAYSEPDPTSYGPDLSGESSPAPAKVDTGHRSIHDVEVSFVSV